MEMLEFAEEVYSYEYKDKPDYSKLRFLLKKEIMKLDKCPDDIFDWNQQIKLNKPISTNCIMPEDPID